VADRARPKRRRLRLEPLERREMLAVASVDSGVVTYKASPGETNNITLSPGEVFSIQDAPDVEQHGEGGFSSSAFLAALGYSFDISVDISAGLDTLFGIGVESGFEADVGLGVGFGVGIPFIQAKLPDGLIGPSPPLSGGSAATGIGSFFADAMQSAGQGKSSVVAGAPVTQDGKVYYDVGAANGTLDEYRLYQALVDPNTAVDETASDNSTYSKAQQVPTGTLIEGSFDASPANDVDYYRFDATQADVGKKFAVILDNDPHKVLSDSVASNDDQAAGTEIQVLYSSYPFVRPSLVANTTSFNDGTALGPFYITRPGSYFISMADKSLREHKDPTDYRFVLVEADTAQAHNQVQQKSFTVYPDMSIKDHTTHSSDMTVNLGSEATIDDVSVAVQINHGYDSDMQAYLVSPSGTRVQLFRKVGDDGNNFGSSYNPSPSTWTVFSDDADSEIADGKAPFPGDYKPMGQLKNFRGEDANGVWKLEITDSVTHDEGNLFGWQLELKAESPVFTFSASPNANITDNATLESPLDASAEGLHSIATTAVQLNLTHDQTDDLSVSLVSPSGTKVNLFQGLGGSGAVDVTLDDYAAQNIQGPTTVQGLGGAITDDGAQNDFPITVSGFNGNVTGLQVGLDITHSNDSDLTAWLISPSGIAVPLFSGVGGTGDNFTGTTISDSATTGIASGTAPFSGVFRPQGGSLSSMNGTAINGTWKLRIVDGTGGNAGKLNNWSLTFAQPQAPLSGRYRPASALSALTGEDPTGAWKLDVVDGDANGKQGTLKDWSLIVSGQGDK
jgi:subtilisin-like proprotein convertase family protein